MKPFFLFIAFFSVHFAFGQYYYGENYPHYHFNADSTPAAPDYANLAHWAALPQKADMADMVPRGLDDGEKEAKVDVFFVHPTTYTGKKGMDRWNGDVNDKALNIATDESPIKYQASVFNESCKIYAPRYRQAHIHAYYTEEEGGEIDAGKALDLAYQDVRKAFEYYLEHFNEGRPFVLASHSQGTTHAGRLLLEMIDGKPLQEQMVAAYVVGIPIPRDTLKTVPACKSPEETGCFCTWRTFARGYTPPWDKPGADFVVTNPLTWRTDSVYASEELNEGGVLRKFDKIRPEVCDAQVSGNMLWINDPNVFGSKLAGIKNWHIADYNLFYLSIRENVAVRIGAYFEKLGE